MKYYLLITTLFLSVSSLAQGFTEGIAEYEVEYLNVPEGISVKDMMMPTEMTLLFKNNLTRAEMPTDFISTKTITNARLGSVLILLDVHDRKLALSMDEQQIQRDLQDGPQLKKVSHTGKTKVFAGHKGIEAWLHFETLMNPYDSAYILADSTKVFYSKNIGSKEINWNTKFKDVDGFLLEYELPQNDMIMRFTANSIKKTKIDNKNFLVPEGYSIMNQEEIENELEKVMIDLKKLEDGQKEER